MLHQKFKLLKAFDLWMGDDQSLSFAIRASFENGCENGRGKSGASRHGEALLHKSGEGFMS